MKKNYNIPKLNVVLFISQSIMEISAFKDENETSVDEFDAWVSDAL